MKFNELSQNIQEEIKDTLKAYSECYVIFENGDYKVTTALSLKREYPKDYKFIGVYRQNGIITEDEKILNYVEQFHDFPSQYTGKKDWKLIKFLQESRENGTNIKLKLVDGNITIG